MIAYVVNKAFIMPTYDFYILYIKIIMLYF